MTSRKRPARQPKAAPKGELKQPRPVWFVTLMAFVLPGSGQVFNGAPARGVIMQFGIVFAAFISYQLTTPEISPIGRMAGGLAVWVFSIVDANGIAKRRVSAWARIQEEQTRKSGRGAAKSSDAGKGVNKTTADASTKSGARKNSASAAARRAGLTAGSSPAVADNSPVPGDGAIATLGPPEPQGS